MNFRVRVVVSLLILLTIFLSCQKDSQSLLQKSSSHKVENQKDNYNSFSQNVDSIQIYLAPICNAIFNTNLNSDTLLRYGQLFSTNSDSISVARELLLNHTNYSEVTVNSNLLIRYLQLNYSNYNQVQIQNILYYAILDYTSSEEIEIRENCKDYKDCIRNARNQAAISAADKLGACVASAFVPVVGGWALLGGFVWATASTMMSYSSEKNACCDTAARNAGCCN